MDLSSTKRPNNHFFTSNISFWKVFLITFILNRVKKKNIDDLHFFHSLLCNTTAQGYRDRFIREQQTIQHIHHILLYRTLYSNSPTMTLHNNTDSITLGGGKGWNEKILAWGLQINSMALQTWTYKKIPSSPELLYLNHTSMI